MWEYQNIIHTVITLARPAFHSLCLAQLRAAGLGMVAPVNSTLTLFEKSYKSWFTEYLAKGTDFSGALKMSCLIRYRLS